MHPETTTTARAVRCERCGEVYEPPFQQHVCRTTISGPTIALPTGASVTLLRDIGKDLHRVRFKAPDGTVTALALSTGALDALTALWGQAQNSVWVVDVQ